MSETSPRVYSVIEFYANKKHVGLGTAHVKGLLSRDTYANCYLGGDGLQIQFDASDLPEVDHIAILESGVNGPPRFATVEIDFSKSIPVALSILFS